MTATWEYEKIKQLFDFFIFPSSSHESFSPTTTIKNGPFKISFGPLASHSISFSVHNNQNLKTELIPGGRRRTRLVSKHLYSSQLHQKLHESFVKIPAVTANYYIQRNTSIVSIEWKFSLAVHEDANEYQFLLDQFQSTNKVLYIDKPSWILRLVSCSGYSILACSISLAMC